jgi:predicted RND superfamily exporter protein
MNRSARLIISYPRTIIAITLAITVVMGAIILIRGVSFNGSPETLARNDSALEFFNQTRDTFGDDRVIILALTTEDVFTPGFIERLDRLTTRLTSIKGVSDVLSLTNVQAINRDADGIVVDRLIPRRATEDQLRQLKSTVTTDPLYEKLYISEDGKTTALSIFINQVSEEQSRVIAQEVESVAKSEAAGDELMLAGVPVMDERAIKSMLSDVLLISPVAGLLCFLVFLFTYRTFWGAALPMLSLIIGNVWTVGVMVLLDKPFTFATLTLPTVLMAIGSSYIFHVLNQFRISMSELDSGADSKAKHQAWLDGVTFIGPSVIVSATTTMAGFAALATSRVPTASDMGAFEATGSFFMLLMSMVFISAVLAILPANALGRVDTQKDYAVWLNSSLQNITAFILHRRRTVLTLSLVGTVIVGLGVFWLRVNTDYLNIFPKSSDTVREAALLHERLAGAASIQIVVSGEPGSIARSDSLQAISALQQFAISQPGVDATLSVADIVKRFNTVFDASSKGLEEIPQDSGRLKAIFDDYLSQSDFVLRLMDKDQSRTVVILRTNLFASNELRGLTAKIENWAHANLPGSLTGRATGSFILLNDASDALAESQSSSLTLALISIYLMMVILFRSFSTGLIALIPNLLPIVCYYGFLGWAGITLDITTSLIASAALGIAVDNAVHMIRRYRQSIEEHGNDEGQVMWLTVLRTGKPMVLANFMLIASNLVFMLSSFIPVQLGGLLWVVTIIACVAADLVFLPALMKTKLFARIAKGNAMSVYESLPDQKYSEAVRDS